MLGLFGLLNLGARSLEVQQTGVAIAGQNLANINNPAYARQRLLIQTSATMATTLGPQGTGVQLASISQVRDELLDMQFRDETSVGGYWTAQQTGFGNAQIALNEYLDASGVSGAADAGNGSGAKGLAYQLNQLFASFQSLAASPSSLTARQAVISQAQTLAGAFNQASSSLAAVRDSLNTSVNNDVSSANQLLSDIAGLNNQIAQAEGPGGGPANELRDQREEKLEALAQLTNFQTSTAADGTLSLSIGGTTLVSGSQTLDTLQSYDAGGGQMLVRTTTGGAMVALTGGSIQGAIAARDGGLADLQTGLDTLAGSLITQVNTIYRGGYDLHGGTGADLFTGNSAGNIGVNAALANDPSMLQASGTTGASGDNQVALALGQLATVKQAALGDQTFTDNYGQLVMKLGEAAAHANDQAANHDAVSNLLLARRDSVSGVSMEEEMSNLVSFQKAYQASARIVSAVDQMLDTILNMKH